MPVPRLAPIEMNPNQNEIVHTNVATMMASQRLDFTTTRAPVAESSPLVG